RAGRVLEQCYLAEDITLLQHIQPSFRAVLFAPQHIQRPVRDHVELIARIALLAHGTILGNTLRAEAAGEALEHVVLQAVEEWHRPQACRGDLADTAI